MTGAAAPFQVIRGGKSEPLPQCEEAERAVVGGLLFSSGAALRKVEPILRAADFYHPVLRVIYEAIVALDQTGVPADLVTVAEQLRETEQLGKLRAYDGEAFLAVLANNVATVENITYHARIVAERSRQRQVIEVGAAVAQRGYQNADEAAAQVAQRLAEISMAGDWAEPAPLTPQLLPVPKMTEAMLPQPLRPWLIDVAERAQCPLEYVAVGAIIGAGSLIGRQVAVCPRLLDTAWRVYANVWGMAVGPPGVLKSPAIAEALFFVYELEREARREFAKKLEEQAVREPVRKAQQKNVELRMQKKALADEIGQGEIIEESMEELEEMFLKVQAQKLVCARKVTNDATIEKLVELLQENPNGLLIHRDELRGLFLSWEKDGHEGDRAFMLEGWSGDGSFTTDRISRGTNHVDGMCLSLVGTIQPGPLAQYVARALRGGDDDGMLQRMQLSVFPDVGTTYVDLDRAPDKLARERVGAIYQRLSRIELAELQAQMDPRGPYLRFEPAAADLATAFREECVRQSLSETEMPAMRAHLSKFRKLHPALSLIFHLLTCADVGWGGPISVEAAELAAWWCRFLAEHMRRICWLGLSQEETPVNLLAARIQADALGDRFTARDVRIKGWHGLKEQADVSRAINELVERNWLRLVERLPGQVGRTPNRYLVNPRIPRKHDQNDRNGGRRG